MNRKEYATDNSAPTVASTGTISGFSYHSVRAAASSIISFDRNPLNSGIPAIDSAARQAIIAVTGISFRRPPSRLISRVWVS